MWVRPSATPGGASALHPVLCSLHSPPTSYFVLPGTCSCSNCTVTDSASRNVSSTPSNPPPRALDLGPCQRGVALLQVASRPCFPQSLSAIDASRLAGVTIIKRSACLRPFPGLLLSCLVDLCLTAKNPFRLLGPGVSSSFQFSDNAQNTITRENSNARRHVRLARSPPRGGAQAIRGHSHYPRCRAHRGPHHLAGVHDLCLCLVRWYLLRL